MTEKPVFINPILEEIYRYDLRIDHELVRQILALPDRYCYCRIEIAVVLSQIALHHPERRDEVISCFRDILNFFILHDEDDTIIDTEMIGLTISSMLLCAGYGVSPEVFQSESPAWRGIKGALTENYVASALVSNGYTSYYWESEGKAEIDFLIQTQQGEVIPVEVKSAENVRSKSFLQFVSRYNPQFSIGISAKNVGFENQIKSIPLYAGFCIDC